VVLVPYAVLLLFATFGRGVIEPARRVERRPEGVAGISDSVRAGEAPLSEALLVARVVRLVDMMCDRGIHDERLIEVWRYCVDGNSF